MNGRETPQIHKYGESKTTRIMTATLLHVTLLHLLYFTGVRGLALTTHQHPVPKLRKE